VMAAAARGGVVDGARRMSSPDAMWLQATGLPA